MADDNRFQGQYLYAAGDAETKAWFQRQWAIWPERADERLTTNLSLHHGGVVAYRIEHGEDPPMSEQFRENIRFLDRDDKGPIEPRVVIDLSQQPLFRMHPTLGRRPSFKPAPPKPLTKRQKRRMRGTPS